MKNKTPSQRARASRRKGHNFEREISAFYKDLGYKTRRGNQGRTGMDEPDVVLNPPDLFVECKAGVPNNIHLNKAWKKLLEDHELGKGLPVLHIHYTRGPRLVVVSEDLWREIIRTLRPSDPPSFYGRGLCPNLLKARTK